jgi:ParB-like chromosome segregation protein Spo0J
MPIILAEISPGKYNVIDGNHRIEKAYRLGTERIPAYILTARQHLRFLTTVKAYHAYVEYWNNKIE